MHLPRTGRGVQLCVVPRCWVAPAVVSGNVRYDRSDIHWDHPTTHNLSRTKTKLCSQDLGGVGVQVHTWDRFDVFRVAKLTQGRPLYTVTLAIMDALGLLVRSPAAPRLVPLGQSQQSALHPAGHSPVLLWRPQLVQACAVHGSAGSGRPSGR